MVNTPLPSRTGVPALATHRDAARHAGYRAEIARNLPTIRAFPFD